MEGDEVVTPPSEEGETQQNDKKEWFSDYADSLCSYYMSIGVSCHDYWHGDYSLLRFYVEADEIRQERENKNAWLQGMYVYDAVGSLAPILHAFSKRGTKPRKYPDEPYAITEKQIKARKKRDEEAQAAETQNHMMAWINSMRSRFRNGGDKEDGRRNNRQSEN